MPETKHFTTKATVTPDGDGQGLLEAVFSTFDTIDSQGDVVLKSTFTEGQEVPMVWSHDWDRPIGKGTVHVTAKQAVFKGQLWLDTDDGLQAFRKIRNSGSLQEFSWGFQILDAEPGVKDGQDVRFIKDATLFEVSPVLVGANRNTHVLSLKGQCTSCAAKADPDSADPDLEEKPYGIRRRGDEHCVYNTETGDTVPGGCHPTRAEALRHQRALMVNVPDAGKSGDAPSEPDPEQEESLSLAERAENAGKTVALLIEFTQSSELSDDDDRKIVQDALDVFSKAHREMLAALKRTDPIAQVEPRNQYRRFQELTARHGLSTAP